MVNFETVEEEKKSTHDHSISIKASSSGVPHVEVMDDYESIINHRGKAYALSRQNSKISEKISDDQESVMGSTQEEYKSLYCRSSVGLQVGLDDFQLITIIGKGNFGKVRSSEFNVWDRFTLCICLKQSSTMP